MQNFSPQALKQREEFEVTYMDDMLKIWTALIFVTHSLACKNKKNLREYSSLKKIMCN